MPQLGWRIKTSLLLYIRKQVPEGGREKINLASLKDLAEPGREQNQEIKFQLKNCIQERLICLLLCLSQFVIFIFFNRSSKINGKRVDLLDRSIFLVPTVGTFLSLAIDD